MDLRLTGKRALVTGSSSGIGRGVALALAAEGAVVAVHGRDTARVDGVIKDIRQAGGVAHPAVGDLATDDGAAAVARQVTAALGGIDILVNNIGGTEGAGSQAWFDVSPEQWGGAMQQNLVGAVRMIHAFTPQMQAARWGRVINISSGGGTQPPANVPAYCAAKAALNNLTVGLSKAVARTGVTVNTVSPGCTRTEMFERALDRLAAQHGWPDDYDSREARFMEMGVYACVTDRFGRPEEVGALVAFIASPLAAFISGANYRIDGGQCEAVN